jgi:hypothetical protein
MVYYRLEKKDRKRFGYHGALAVHVGLNGFKFPDFTYKLHAPQTRQFIFRRDVLFAEDCMPHCESRMNLSNFSQDHWARPGVGVLSRSVLKEATEDVSKSLEGWDEACLTMAATNLAREPTSWMKLSECAASPIKLQDTIVVDFEDHKVVGISPAGVKVKSVEAVLPVLVTAINKQRPKAQINGGRRPPYWLLR